MTSKNRDRGPAASRAARNDPWAGRSAVVGLFDRQTDAEAAINALKAAGFRDQDIGVAMRDRSAQGELIEDTGTQAAEGATAGAVGGGVVGGAIGLVRSTDTSGSSASKSADHAGSTAERQSGSDAGSADSEAPAYTPQTIRGVPQLTTASFGADAARLMQEVADSPMLLDVPSAPTASEPTRSPADSLQGTKATSGSTTTSGSKALEAPPVTATPGPQFSVRGAAPCAGPAIAGAVTLPAMLDDTRVALVFLPPTASGQQVQAWSCNGDSLLADATVPR